MENVLIKSLACGNNALILWASNADLLETICHRQPIRTRPLRHALALTVSAASLLAGTLKEPQRVSLQVKLSNPASTLLADADWRGHVRGTAGDGPWQASAGRIDDRTIAQMVGDRGTVRVVKDIGMFRSVTGITDMPFRNIVDDLSHYFQQSEQTPTCFAIHIGYAEDGRIGTAIGVLAQLLPGAPAGLIDDIRAVLKRLSDIPSETMKGEAFRRMPFHLFDDVEIKEERLLHAACDCSRDMMMPMLYSLGMSELTAACKRRDAIEVTCHLCGQTYVFEPDEILALLRMKKDGPAER